MKKKLLALALVLGGSSVAVAGAKVVIPVTINLDPAYRTAFGTMGSARNSADGRQYLQCSTTRYAGSQSSYSSGGCTAHDAKGASLYCTTRDPDLMRQIEGIPADGFVQFQSLADNTCNYIMVERASQYEPKQ